MPADGDDGGHVGGEELGAGDGDSGAERVADEHRPLETEPADGLVKQVGLADRRVTVSGRRVAVAVSGAVEGDHPVAPRQEGGKADLEVVGGAEQSVDEHNRPAGARSACTAARRRRRPPRRPAVGSAARRGARAAG